MKHDHFVVQSPDKPAQQLLLLFHGVGDNPVAMGEIGSWFAPLFPDHAGIYRNRSLLAKTERRRTWGNCIDRLFAGGYYVA